MPLFAAQIVRRWRGCGEGRGAGYRTHLHQLVNTYTLNPVRHCRGAYQVLRPCRTNHVRATYGYSTRIMRTRARRTCANQGTCQISGVSKNLNEADALHLSLHTSKLLNASVNMLLQNDFCLLQKREMWSNGSTGAPNMTSCTTELQRLLKYQEDSSTQLVKAENKTQ